MSVELKKNLMPSLRMMGVYQTHHAQVGGTKRFVKGAHGSGWDKCSSSIEVDRHS
jgi:hypothetical protein